MTVPPTIELDQLKNETDETYCKVTRLSPGIRNGHCQIVLVVGYPRQTRPNEPTPIIDPDQLKSKTWNLLQNGKDISIYQIWALTENYSGGITKTDVPK